MTKIVCLTGAQGVGKTTLAERVVSSMKDNRVRFDNYSTRSVAEKYGYSSHEEIVRDSHMNPERVISFQYDLIKGRWEWMMRIMNDGPEDEVVITDRSVLDSFIYYLVHNSFYEKNEERSKEMLQYTVQVVNHPKIYHVEVHSWSIELSKGVPDNGIRNTSTPYQILISSLISTYLASMLMSKKPLLVLTCTSLDARVNLLKESILDIME